MDLTGARLHDTRFALALSERYAFAPCHFAGFNAGGHPSESSLARLLLDRSSFAEPIGRRTAVDAKRDVEKAPPSDRAFLLRASPSIRAIGAGRSNSGRDRCTRQAARSSFLTISQRRSREAATGRSPGSTRRSR